jgi:hypothetical protein
LQENVAEHPLLNAFILLALMVFFFYIGVSRILPVDLGCTPFAF